MRFLPQRSYMILASLRDQLCYPRAWGVCDAALVAILKQVNREDLPERVGGLDAELRWQDLLSLGEQQQIAFARLLRNRPAYAFLDKATSALDSANEEILYEGLASAQINVVSVGNRAALLKYHHTLLELLGDGDWRISRTDCSRTAETAPSLPPWKVSARSSSGTVRWQHEDPTSPRRGRSPA